ncbi:helix-turn-helix domain-containing protein [Sphingopyxis sp.]|uniref:helix-turn-helix domain-containing protein n=1 Tax=Sphingopyxis sp. TaxID=1908224 RepID=UPI0035B3D16D
MSASAGPVGGDAGENLPKRLRRLREQSGLSRSELAERTGFSRPTIWAWESGKTQPRHNNLQTLAVALGISEVELVAGDATAAFSRDEPDMLIPSAWQNGDLPAGLANQQRLRIMIYAAKLGIAALAGIKVQNVKISIEL